MTSPNCAAMPGLRTRARQGCRWCRKRAATRAAVSNKAMPARTAWILALPARPVSRPLRNMGTSNGPASTPVPMSKDRPSWSATIISQISIRRTTGTCRYPISAPASSAMTAAWKPTMLPVAMSGASQAPGASSGASAIHAIASSTGPITGRNARQKVKGTGRNSNSSR